MCSDTPTGEERLSGWVGQNVQEAEHDIAVFYLVSARYRFKEYAIPWYMNRKYKGKRFYTPSFVQPYIR